MKNEFDCDGTNVLSIYSLFEFVTEKMVIALALHGVFPEGNGTENNKVFNRPQAVSRTMHLPLDDLRTSADFLDQFKP